MQPNNLYRIFILALSIVSFTHCKKDELRKSYNNINDVSFTPVTDTFRVNQFETLKITPQLKQNQPDESSLRFEWKVLDGGLDTTMPLSASRNLDVVVTVPAAASPYTFVVKVTNIKTGVAYFAEYKVAVSSSLGEGWVLLEEKTGGTELHLISPKEVLYRNIYSGVNNGKLLPANTLSLVTLPNFVEYRTYALTADNLIMLNKDDFRYVTNADKLFLFEKPAVVKPEECIVDGMGTVNLLINNGGLHTINFINQGPKVFAGRFSGNYKLAPFIANGWAYDGVAFDQKNGRFMFAPPFSSTLSQFPPRSAADAFDMSAINMTLQYMDIGVNQNYQAIFKDPQTSEYFVHTINPNAFDPQPVAVAKKQVHNSPEMKNATAFATSGRTQQLYYAVGNSIYLYDLENDQLSRKLYAFPANEQITAMKMQRTTTWMFYPGPADDTRLAVATYNGEAGQVYYLDLNSTGEISNGTYSKKFTGFGKIKSLTYKRVSF